MSNTDKLTFPLLKIGHRFELGSVSLSKSDIIEFADRYDPQDFHLDEDAARAVFGGLAASGWQTASLYQRLLVLGFLGQVACLGGAGAESLQFVSPVFANDSLSGSVTIADKRLSKSKPDRGIVTLYCEMTNQQGKPVMKMTAKIVVATHQ